MEMKDRTDLLAIGWGNESWGVGGYVKILLGGCWFFGHLDVAWDG